MFRYDLRQSYMNFTKTYTICLYYFPYLQIYYSKVKKSDIVVECEMFLWKRESKYSG